MFNEKTKSINWYTIDIILKHIKNFIRGSLDFLNKCPRDVDVDDEFSLQTIDYFFTKYQVDFTSKISKEFVLESEWTLYLKTTR